MVNVYEQPLLCALYANNFIEGSTALISREKLEQQQIYYYIIALFLGAMLGLFSPTIGATFDSAISITLAFLMYSMFSQIPFTALKQSFAHKRFILALLTTNFIVVPIVAWLLTRLLPDHPATLLGVFLVLLTPCIDYVIVFTALGRGDAKLMLLATPILFVAQMLLLPFYLTFFIGKHTAAIIEIGPFVDTFLTIILLPLAISIMLQLFAMKKHTADKIIGASSWLPVPLMALTLFIIVASQITKVIDYTKDILVVIPIYVLFMLIMPWLAKIVAKLFRLNVATGRTLIFSSFTRNSLVVLPLALALPSSINTFVAAIIVTQTIIEIIMELLYIRIVPAIILRDH